MQEFEQLRQAWIDAGVAPADPASSEAVAEFERRWKLNLPESFRRYLLVAGGMQDAQTDSTLLSFLSLPAIDAEWQQRVTEDNSVVFAEYLIWSHWYLIQCDTGAVVAADGKHRQQIADSFQEFVADYLKDPQRIAYCWTALKSTPAS